MEFNIPKNAEKALQVTLPKLSTQQITFITKQIVQDKKTKQLTKENALINKEYFMLYEHHPELFDKLFEDSFEEDDLIKFLECINIQSLHTESTMKKSAEEEFEHFLFEKYKQESQKKSHENTEQPNIKTKVTKENQQVFNHDNCQDHKNEECEKTHEQFNHLIGSCSVVNNENFHPLLNVIYEKCKIKSPDITITSVLDLLKKYKEFFECFLNIGFYPKSSSFCLKNNTMLMEEIHKMSPMEFQNCCNHFDQFSHIIYGSQAIYNYENHTLDNQLVVRIFLCHVYIYDNHQSYGSLMRKLQENELTEKQVLVRILQMTIYESLFNAKFFDSNESLGQYLVD